MSVFNKEEENSKGVETIIGSSVKVEGNFVGSGDIIIEGQINGTIKTSRNIRVGEQAKVKADIEAANVFNAGEIRGNIKVTEKIELKSTAKVLGNVEAGILSVEEGGIMNGKCQMVRKDEISKEMPVEQDLEETTNRKNKK